MDVTKKDQVEALAKEHEHIDVLFNVAGFVFPLSSLFFFIARQSHESVTHTVALGDMFLHYIIMGTVVYLESLPHHTTVVP